MVQAWVNNPASNNGFAISSGGTTDGADLSSSEVATVTSRPLLRLTYH